MPRLDRGRGQKNRGQGRRGQVTGVTIVEPGPPPVDYTKKYEPAQGCPLTAYIKEYYDDNQQKGTDYKQKVHTLLCYIL